MSLSLSLEKAVMMGFWGKRKKFPEKDLALSLAKSKSKWFLFFFFFFSASTKHVVMHGKPGMLQFMGSQNRT